MKLFILQDWRDGLWFCGSNPNQDTCWSGDLKDAKIFTETEIASYTPTHGQEWQQLPESLTVK